MLERLYYWVVCYALWLCVCVPLSLGFYYAFMADPCFMDWLRKRLLHIFTKNPLPETKDESEEHENE